MSRTLIVVALSLSLAYGSSAAADDLATGDGHDGELVVSSAGVVVNRYATLAADVAPGESTILVSSTADFSAGDVVLLHQAQRALAPPASGDQSDVDAAAIGVGAYELLRVISVDSVVSTLTFAAAVQGSFFAPGAQVVLVPEYTTLRVQSGASLTAPAWNGETGGVVAVLVQGSLENAGVVTTTGRGFRGGVMVNNASYPSGCSGLDEPAPTGQQKGEGVYRGRYGADATGTGNVANGAGGAVCVNAGGAGGGGAGQGGHGGASWDGARVEAGGLGGAAVSTTIAQLLVFGGGGGAGHGNDNAATSGGAGGGAIFVRAGAVLGDGQLTASGSGAVDTGNDGGGGGGGGGSIVASVVEEASCYSWSAVGGKGASVGGGHGQGGGGGGGRVFLRSSSGQCPVSVLAGLAGATGNPGATPTSASDPLHVGVADVPPAPAAVDRPTFYYGRGVGSSNSLRVVGMVDGTTYTIRDINTDVVLASGTLNRFQQLTQAINGRHFKVEASQPLLAILYLSSNGGTFFLPAEGSNVRTGRRFVLHHPGAAHFLCYAFEPSEAVIRRSDDSVFATRSMPAYSMWEPGIAANTSYTLTGTGRMACQALAINAYDTVPDKSGGDVGTDFLFATHSWSPGGGYAVIAYDDTDVVVSDIATGAEVQRFSLAAGTFFHRSNLSNARLRLTSTGRVSVWAGDHEGGSTIGYMGDDLAFHNGIGGREFYIHTQIVGATIFASSDDTVVEVDGVATTLAADDYLDLAANQFVHILASKPVVVQTFGGGSLNDYANVLRAVPAGPVSSLGVTLSLTEVEAGVPLDVTVVARDASSGVDVGYRGTVGFSSLDPSALLPADYTFSEADQGQHTFYDGVALTRSGTQLVLVEDRDNPVLQGEAAVVVLPSSLDAATSTVSVAPATVDANGIDEAEITVVPRDAYGNRLGAGLAVVVQASAGTLDPVVTDAGDGSYLARLTAPAAPAVATVSAEVDGVLLDEQAVVDFIADQTAPEGVTLTAGPVTDTSADLSYTESPSADATGYELSRYDALGGLLGVDDLGAASGTTVTGLSSCTAYGFEVRAYDGAGNRSASSNRVEVSTVLAGAPLPPSGVVAEPRDSYVRLRWDPSVTCDALSYRVYRSDVAGGPYTLVADDVDGFAALDLYLENGQTFYYVVTTVDREGLEGGYSAEVSASPTAADPGDPVEALLATGLPGGFIELSWLLPPDADALGFRVYRSDAPITALADAVLVGETAEPTLLDLPPADGVFHYTVTWIDVVGSESYPAASVEATSDRVAPTGNIVVDGAAPHGIGAAALSLTVDEDLQGSPALFVSWPGVSERELAVTADASDARLFGSLLVVEEGDPEALAVLSARLVDATGNVGSLLFGDVEVAIDGVRPTAVIATSPPDLLPIGAASVTLTAREPLATTPSLSLELADGALVDVPLTDVGSPEPALGFAGALEVLDTMASGEARFVTSLTDEAGNSGGVVTAGMTVVVDTVLPSPPTALVASVGSLGSVVLSWLAPSGDADASYVLYRDDTEIVDVTGLPPVQTGIASTGTSDLPPADGTWFYAVAAVDRAGNLGPPSPSVEATSDQTAPGAPTGLSAAQRDAVVDLAWTAPGGETPASYAVFRSTASFQGSLEGHTAIIPTTQSTSVSDRPAGEGRYHYVVAARDRVGLLSAPSNEVEVLFDNHAPAIVIENVSEGGHYAAAVQPVVTITDVTLESSSITLDGAPFVSGDTVSAEAAHTLVATASDAAGRTSTRTVPFVLDFTAPELDVAGVSEGGHYESAPAATFSATDSYLVEVSARLDGAAYASGTPVVTDGFHTLVVTARDRAGNVATASVGFSVDLPPAAVRGVIAVVEDGGIDLAWSSSPESDVVEYRVIRDGVLIAAPGIPKASGGAAPEAPERARFEIRAVDAAGHVGPARSFSVSAVRLALVAYGTPDGAGGSSLTRGYFDDVALQVLNDDVTALEAGPPRFELLDNEDVSWWEEAGVAKVTVPGGGAALLDDVVYAHPELDPADNTLVADVELPAPAEVTVLARARFPLEMRFPPGATVEPVHGTLVRGAEADIELRATNHGSAPVELVNAGAGGTPSPDLEVRLLHPDGTVLARASVVDAVAGTVRANGERVSTLESGASRTFAPVRLLIPGDAPDNILLEVEAKQIHSRFGSEGHRVEDGFLYSRARNVVPPPYLVTATTDKAEYNQGELVFVSGVATDTETGAIAPDVVARVIIGNAGFEQSFYVRTSAEGIYQLPFSTGPVAAGVFSVSAVHPTVLTREQDATFLVHGLRLDPGSFQLTLSKGASFPVTMTLRNTGASAVTGIDVALVDAVADDGVTAIVENAPSALSAGSSATFSLTVSAEQAAADTAAFDLTLTNDQGATRTSRIDVALYAAAPSLVATPRFLDVGVAAGTSTVRTVVVENKGYGTWLGAQVVPPADVPWILVPTGAALGDIAPGERASFDVLFVPPEDEPSSLVSTSLTLTSANVPDVPLFVGVNVTASGEGAVEVMVTNLIYAVTEPDKPVPGARVRLLSQDNFTLWFEGSTDLAGRATFPVVPAGRYSYVVTADGFQTVTGGAEGAEAGAILVEPGQTAPLSVGLVESFVDVSFSVTPTTVEDQYDIVVDTTYETHVPIPVLLVTPHTQHFDMKPGTTRTGQIQITNLGLVSAFNVELNPSQDHYLDVQYQFTRIAEVPAQSSVIVPFTVYLKTHASPPPEPCTDFGADFYLAYEWYCDSAGNFQQQVVPGVNLSVTSHEANVQVEPSVILRPTFINCPGTDGFVDSVPPTVATTNMEGSDVQICDCGKITTMGFSFPQIAQIVDILKSLSDERYVDFCNQVMSMVGAPTCDDAVSGAYDAAGETAFGDDWDDVKQTVSDVQDVISTAEQLSALLKSLSDGECAGQSTLDALESLMTSLANKANKKIMNDLLDEYTGGKLGFDQSVAHFDTSCLASGQTAYVDLAAGGGVGAGTAQFSVQHGCGPDAQCCPVTVPYVDLLVICTIDSIGIASQGGMLPSEPGSGGPNYWYPGYSFPWSSDYCAVPL